MEMLASPGDMPAPRRNTQISMADQQREKIIQMVFRVFCMG
jgi:hypothetical protein